MSDASLYGQIHELRREQNILRGQLLDLTQRYLALCKAVGVPPMPFVCGNDLTPRPPSLRRKGENGEGSTAATDLEDPPCQHSLDQRFEDLAKVPPIAHRAGTRLTTPSGRH